VVLFCKNSLVQHGYDAETANFNTIGLLPPRASIKARVKSRQLHWATISPFTVVQRQPIPTEIGC
jgi:hypothetical protein